MALRDIITYGHPTLRRRAKPVTDFNAELQKFAEDMFETMHAAEGVGLAAVQVNESIHFCVMQVPREGEEPLRLMMANPRIVESQGSFEFEEGCLSVPDIRDVVIRPEWIRVEYQDMDGNPQTLEADGLLARVIQHEVDHLNGVLFVDRLTLARQARWEGALKKLAKTTSDS